MTTSLDELQAEIALFNETMRVEGRKISASIQKCDCLASCELLKVDVTTDVLCAKGWALPDRADVRKSIRLLMVCLDRLAKSKR